LVHYPWRRHLADADSYWCTPQQAATVLGVSVQHVKQLLATDKFPHVVHSSGTRLMRRAQLEIHATSQTTRKHRG
jgi:hypothetical protein